MRLRGIKIIHGLADSIVPINEARSFTNALNRGGLSFDFETHSGDHVFRADLALPFFHKHLAGAELYVARPTIAIRANPVRISFGTQSNVVYVLRDRHVMDNGWAPTAFWLGTGENVTVELSGDGDSRIFQLEAKNAETQ